MLRRVLLLQGSKTVIFPAPIPTRVYLASHDQVDLIYAILHLIVHLLQHPVIHLSFLLTLVSILLLN